MAKHEIFYALCDLFNEGEAVVEKSMQIDPCRRKKIEPLVKIRLTPKKSWRRGSI